MIRKLSFACVLLGWTMLLLGGCCGGGRRTQELQTPPQAQSPKAATVSAQSPATQWTSLFDGKSLGQWKPAEYAGQGEVRIEDGSIVMETGSDITGITWAGQVPTMNYEITYQAKRITGSDFFAALTFPVGKSHCTLVNGGWGGSTVGLSSLDGQDASDNDTSQMIGFDRNRWYTFRIRVTPKLIEAWLDKEQIISADIFSRSVGTRIEVDPSKPLGFAAWQTSGAVRDIRIRTLEP